MLRCLIYWLFLKYVNRVEREEGDDCNFVRRYRDIEHRLAVSKAKLKELHQLRAERQAKRDTS